MKNEKEEEFLQLIEERDYSDLNRISWETASKYHVEQFNYLINQFTTESNYNHIDKDETELLLKEPISIKGKNVVQLCCNNGREILSIKNLGAAYCLGVDFSNSFINQAKEIAGKANIDCEFICSKVTEIPEEYYGEFDVIYISAGTLGWQQNLEDFFETVAKLKTENGVLFVREIHPFTDMLEVDKNVEEENVLKLVNSYFVKEPLVDENGLDYFNKTDYEAPKSYWFHHKISDVISVCIKNGFNISSFKEYSEDVSSEFEELETRNIVPLSYIFIAESNYSLTNKLQKLTEENERLKTDYKNLRNYVQDKGLLGNKKENEISSEGTENSYQHEVEKIKNSNYT